MKFSLIHPSRSRPEKSIATMNKWFDKCSNHDHIEIIISIDTDDPSYEEYCKGMFFHKYPVKLYPNIRIEVNNNTNAVQAINNAAAVSMGDILMVVSDDTDCPEKWDNIILDATEGHKDFVLKVKCGIQKRIITMPILDRVYYNRDQRIYNPIYRHSWSDTEFTEVAHLRGRVIVRNDIMFRHLHPEFTKEPKDELYLRNDKTHDEDRHIFEERKRINFGL